MTFGFHQGEQWSELPLPFTIHPCRSPLLPPGIYTNGILSYTSTLLLFHIPFHDTRSTYERVGAHSSLTTHETSCPTNRDLSLLLVLMEAIPCLRTLARDEQACEHLYVYSREIVPPFTFCYFSFSPRFLPDRLKTPTSRSQRGVFPPLLALVPHENV